MSDRRIFISHCDADREFALQLADGLRDRLDLDVRHILQSGGSKPRIALGVRHSAASHIKRYPIFIVVLSPDALASAHVQHELRLALAAARSHRATHIFPVLHRPCEIPADLTNFPLISFAPPASDILALKELALSVLRLQCQHASGNRLLREGKRLRDRKRYEEATVVLEWASKREPKSWRIWAQRGVTLYSAKQYEESAGAFDMALTLVKPWPSIDAGIAKAYLYESKARALNILGRYNEALTALDESLKHIKRSGSTWITKSIVLCNVKRYEDAIVAADHAIAINASNPVTWDCKGKALIGLKRYEEAAQTYGQATKWSSDYPPTWINMGLALARLHRYEEA